MVKKSNKEISNFKNKKLLFAAWAAENKSYTSYQYFYNPLNKIFKNIVLFDPQKNMYNYGKKRMNQKFLELVRKEQPDYIFFWLVYDEFYLDTLKNVKKVSLKTKTINFFGDDDTLFDSFTRFYSLFFDYNLISPQLPPKTYVNEGMKNVFFSFGTNLDNFKPLNIEKKYDVTFIGTPKKDRYDFIKHLLNNGIDVKIFGWGWDKYPDLKNVYFGPLDSEDLVRVANQSKINLSFSKNYFGEPHLKGRVTEIGACKSFILVEHSPRFLDLFKDKKEIIMFKDEKDLLKKVKYYLKNEKEREKTTRKMYEKIVNNFDLDKELNDFFEKISNNKFGPSKGLSKLNKKIVVLSKSDLYLESIKEKVKDADFIAFNDSNGSFLPYKNYFQAYSLIKSKKDISCCDYHVYSRSLGDYLTVPTKFAFNVLDDEDFSKLITINQLVVRKDYLLKNIEKFKTAFVKKRISFVDKTNTTFVTIPLVRLKNLPKIEYNKVKEIIYAKLVYDLHALNYNRKLLFSAYPYNLIFSSIVLQRGFILRYLLDSFLNKKNWNKLINKVK